MLSVAVLGLAVYGVYSVGLGVVDLFGVYGLDWWADAALVLLGLVLVLGAALARLLIPGAFALVAGALLALQALSFHNDVHFYGQVLVLPQVVRGVIAATLLIMAQLGAPGARQTTEERRA